MAKVVDDMLLAGLKKKLEEFRLKLCKELTVDEDHVFNGLTIHQEPDFSTSVNMKEFLYRILSFDISRECRKQHDHA